jgi:hypothetical protein
VERRDRQRWSRAPASAPSAGDHGEVELCRLAAARGEPWCYLRGLREVGEVVRSGEEWARWAFIAGGGAPWAWCREKGGDEPRMRLGGGAVPLSRASRSGSSAVEFEEKGVLRCLQRCDVPGRP